MVSDQDKSAICSLAKQYNVRRVLLFGSSLDSSRESHDIDLAVEGVSPEQFFKFYGDLLFCLSKPVDLVDLTRSSRFIDLIAEEGVALYG